MQVHSVSHSSAERPVSHDTGWWFPLPWRHFLLPASGLVGNLSQGYSPPSLALFSSQTGPSDKVTVNTLPHTSLTVIPHTQRIFPPFVQAAKEFLVILWLLQLICL